jgi:predicted kinase
VSRITPVPRLILLNGPPACGKSTLARLYADAHPPTLNLDIDRVRAMIGGWLADPAATGSLAREVALAAARVHLAAGHDVVVPQLVGRLDFIARLEAVASESGAGFHEVFLLADEQSAQLLYRERAAAVASAVPPDPVVSTNQTPSQLADAYALMLRTVAERPGAVVIRTQPGRIAEAYQALLDRVA